jgi:FtsP/CotA-like multicopper oxidase with cupredoxin domain
LFAGAVSVLSWVHQAAAQQGLQTPRIVTPPPAAQVLRARPNANLLAFDTIIAGPPRAAGEAEIELNIDYSDSKIYNPATGQYDVVRLRSYKDAKQTTPGRVPFVAPTIDIAPGETVRLTLHNLLKPTNQNCPSPDGKVNTPHCFNRTNLHSHGLWVSPTGNSDNVLISINPGVTFQYEYNVPSDHPAGTFWYHPHLHGSTALQVSSGMAGLLIVRGNRPPTPQAPGDIDILLKEATGAAFPERPVLLQQVQYACRDSNGKIEVDGNGAYVCKPGEMGGIEGYDQFGPGSWPKSGRYTSINGEVLPVFPGAQAGRIERWRVAHAGVRDSVKLQFKKMRPGVGYDQLADAQAQQDWVAANCLGDPLPQFAIASDGLTRREVAQRQTTVLQPGYREDLLMVFPESGDYCVIDDQAPANANINAEVKSRKLLGSVNVGVGTSAGNDLRAFVTAQLLAAADRNVPLAMRQKVRDDLSNDLRLTSFDPHPDITDGEIRGRQTADLRIGAAGFQVNGVPYDPNGPPRMLTLGSADEWTLTAGAPGHPFHIHVNPFQIVAIRNPSNVDVSVDGEADDPQYANLKGEWRDTLFVKAGYTITTRSRYRRYIGDFVLHCHILDHEDQGMMQNVRVAIPDGSGGVADGHH